MNHDFQRSYHESYIKKNTYTPHKPLTERMHKTKTEIHWWPVKYILQFVYTHTHTHSNILPPLPQATCNFWFKVTLAEY